MSSQGAKDCTEMLTPEIRTELIKIFPVKGRTDIEGLYAVDAGHLYIFDITAATTSAFSEGINYVIKMVQRRAFGSRNMKYFKLRIIQVYGYLRSRILENQASGT